VRIAVLSGKGGTGKTLISVNLASVAEASAYIDCDVEEPNGHLFLSPENIQEDDVTVLIPQVDNTLCDGCRQCVSFCRFNALAYVNEQLIVLEDICHSCGGCVLICPQQALREKAKIIGQVWQGSSERVQVTTGMLMPGVHSGTPIVSQMMQTNMANPPQLIVIDCPPGSSCIVMSSIKNSNYCVLVAEPTIFGLHNFKMVYDLVRLFQLPCGVVLNKQQTYTDPVKQFCLDNQIKILARIPYDEELAHLSSKGQIAVKVNEKYRVLFSKLLNTIIEEATHETTPHS